MSFLIQISKVMIHIKLNYKITSEFIQGLNLCVFGIYCSQL